MRTVWNTLQSTITYGVIVQASGSDSASPLPNPGNAGSLRSSAGADRSAVDDAITPAGGTKVSPSSSCIKNVSQISIN